MCSLEQFSCQQPPCWQLLRWRVARRTLCGTVASSTEPSHPRMYKRKEGMNKQNTSSFDLCLSIFSHNMLLALLYENTKREQRLVVKKIKRELG
jgi:hypothetical protein